MANNLIPSKWKPPDEDKNPYKEVEPLKQVMGFVFPKTTIVMEDFESKETKNPYVDL